MMRYVEQSSCDNFTIHAHRTGHPKAFHFESAEAAVLARNVTFELIIAVNALYVIKRAPTTALETHASDRMKNWKSGQVLRVVGIELSASTDALRAVPDFQISVVNLSEQNHPGMVLTKTHLQDYSARMRGGDRNHHARGGGENHVLATQLPLGYYDDQCINQVQGNKVKHGLLDLTGIFQVGQFATGLGRFEDLDRCFMIGIGRIAKPDGKGGIEVIWEEVKKVIAQHPRAVIWWYDQGELQPVYDAELRAARSIVNEMNARASAATTAFGTHGGLPSNYAPRT